MPAAARGQVNCSARRRALLRRSPSGLLMIDVTARAMASGSLSAVAPLSVVRISASAGVWGPPGGGAGRQRLEGRQPERFVRPGRERDVGGGEDGRDGVATADEA